MAPKVAKAYQPPKDRISKSRVFSSAVITLLVLGLLLLWGYNFLWAIRVVRFNYYGSLLLNFVIAIGSLIANATISLRVLRYLNETLIGDKIDADHKKYI
ncbi:hypothetical protein CANTEDRAFT_113280 [Yamadazyma tenuis ATCC 10573]|uniref:Vacuolar ATPase assembly integral membrane protein VMA21 n=1 Tax=Candida tenuis (strain ATCC 10573 / BCRC 21748 / CBS 615 / JCM 9827 / NBRC 10315 / NRRL Y-1498 / VKM Y-70) TaxID=590646 RepID=G3B1R5_CANTC|nr:uncharacterized protein CANTEDRAFT_113280 [Yamadazyma tenuis ATCC 10573]EGV64511.1 hypothetical protein CANTEDRAFT_113280 [Yamadazyma tenuis ATCC 10573]